MIEFPSDEVLKALSKDRHVPVTKIKEWIAIGYLVKDENGNYVNKK